MVTVASQVQWVRRGFYHSEQYSSSLYVDLRPLAFLVMTGSKKSTLQTGSKCHGDSYLDPHGTLSNRTALTAMDTDLGPSCGMPACKLVLFILAVFVYLLVANDTSPGRPLSVLLWLPSIRAQYACHAISVWAPREGSSA